MGNNERMVLATRLPESASQQEHDDFQRGLELMAAFMQPSASSDAAFTFLPNPLLASWPQE